MPFKRYHQIRQHYHPPDLMLSRSRSTSDLNHHHHHRQHHHDPRVPYGLVPNRVEVLPPPNSNNFYRISRKRILGSVMRMEQEEQALEHIAEAIREFDVKTKDPNDAPSDEGIYLHSESSNSDHNSFKRRYHSQSRSNSALHDSESRGWVPALPEDVVDQVRERTDKAEDFHYHQCTCTRPRYQSKNYSRSDHNLLKLEEEEYANDLQGSQVDLELAQNARKVTEERLQMIASFHQLPRIGQIKPQKESPHLNNGINEERVLTLDPDQERVLTQDPDQDIPMTTSQQLLMPIPVIRTPAGRFLKNKRQRNRTLTGLGIHEMFSNQEEVKALEQRLDTTEAEEVDERRDSAISSSNSSGTISDAGICLQYGSPTDSTTLSSAAVTSNSSMTSSRASPTSSPDCYSDTEESELKSGIYPSDTDSLEINLEMFNRRAGLESDNGEEGSEDDQFVKVGGGTPIHNYIASRGQREKEQEIYEVLPSTIPLEKRQKPLKFFGTD